jgi:DNA mismatch repair protein MutL
VTGISKPSRRIRILRDDVSRKIAAGEVIDRPFSIVRELADNAIDAGARSIDLFLEAGGISRIRMVDDGVGMSREDIELCWLAHATSKIESEDDLLTVSSLGFRGEALSSMAACSRLSIVSAESDGGPAHRLDVLGGKLIGLGPSEGRPGTTVEVSELFHNFPARKKFLRSVSAESALCRNMLVDRAVSHPSIAFRLFTDGALKLALPAASPVERISFAYSPLLASRVLGLASRGESRCTATVVGAPPELRRKDRKLMQVFVNRRRIAEFALVQAIEYGYEGYIPGGLHPIAFLFVEIDPGLVDFNIHPAKKEVRFRSLPEVHQTAVGAVRDLLSSITGRTIQGGRVIAAGRHLSETDEGFISEPASEAPAVRSYAGDHAETRKLPLMTRESEEAGKGTFIGRVFDIFLVFELPERLLLLDQHAAHERIIYDRISAAAPRTQELLFPLAFDVSEEEAERLARSLRELAGAGIVCARTGSRAFEVTALAEDFLRLPEDELLRLIRDAGKDHWMHALRAAAACRLAIKEGDPVDRGMAEDLCRRALLLDTPRCPHGRPLWHEVTRGTLLRMVDRELSPVAAHEGDRPPATRRYGQRKVER